MYENTFCLKNESFYFDLKKVYFWKYVDLHNFLLLYFFLEMENAINYDGRRVRGGWIYSYMKYKIILFFFIIILKSKWSMSLKYEI